MGKQVVTLALLPTCLPSLLIGGSRAFLRWDATTQMLKTPFVFSMLGDMKLLPRRPGPPKWKLVCDPVDNSCAWGLLLGTNYCKTETRVQTCATKGMYVLNAAVLRGWRTIVWKLAVPVRWPFLLLFAPVPQILVATKDESKHEMMFLDIF